MFHFALGRRSVVHIAAQLILVAKKITDCNRVQKLASKAARDLVETVTATIPFPVKHIKNSISTRFEKDLPFIASCIEACPHTIIELAMRVDLTIRRLITLIGQLFALSINLLEVFEAMIADDITDYESITGLFSNAKTVIQRLAEDIPGLIQGLGTNKELIEKTLTHFGADYSFLTLSTMTVESLHKISKVSGTIFTTIKDILWDTAFVFGLHNTPKVFDTERHITYSIEKNNELCTPNASCKTRNRSIHGRFYTSY